MRTHTMRSTAVLLLLASVLLPASAFAVAPSYLTQWGTAGTGSGQFNAPFDAKVGAGGNVDVADAANNRVQVFTGSGAYLFEWANGQFLYPYGIGLDASGDIYVTDAGNIRVQEFGQLATPTHSITWGAIKSRYR